MKATFFYPENKDLVSYERFPPRKMTKEFYCADVISWAFNHWLNKCHIKEERRKSNNRIERSRWKNEFNYEKEGGFKISLIFILFNYHNSSHDFKI